MSQQTNITIRVDNKLSLRHMLPLWGYRFLVVLFEALDRLRDRLNGASATSVNVKSQRAASR